VAVDGANRPDMKMVAETLDSLPIERPVPTIDHKQNMCLDKGYAYDEVRQLLAAFGWTVHIPPKGKDAQTFKRRARAKARRWVVERAHSWLNRFRGLLIRWSKKAENYMALLHMAFAFVILHKMELSG
jgi:putative transposase